MVGIPIYDPNPILSFLYNGGIGIIVVSLLGIIFHIRQKRKPKMEKKE